jgi:hypothetical protein
MLRILLLLLQFQGTGTTLFAPETAILSSWELTGLCPSQFVRF